MGHPRVLYVPGDLHPVDQAKCTEGHTVVTAAHLAGRL
jgi:hypothetical protein